jgi:pyruvate-formate lyase
MTIEFRPPDHQSEGMWEASVWVNEFVGVMTASGKSRFDAVNNLRFALLKSVDDIRRAARRAADQSYTEH